MKLIKKAILTGMLTTAIACTMANSSKAATVKVTGDTLNIRKGPSTNDSVVAMMNKNTECELVSEEGEWYQIKYKNYTGYISKQYAEVVETSNDNNENQNETENQNEANNQDNSNNQENSNNQSNQDVSDNQENMVEPNDQTNNEASNNQASQDDNNEPQSTIIYKKFTQDAEVKILPLIHSSQIGKIKKDSQVILLTQTTMWSYIQSDEISGWVRNQYLVDGENPNADSNSSSNEGTAQSNNQTSNSSEKTAYINENTVNLRKGAGTNNSIIKVLTLNTQITIIGEEGSWYQVKVGDDTGYVSKEFVSDSKKVTSRGDVSREEESKEDEEIKAEEQNSQETKQNEVNNDTETAEEQSSIAKGTDVVAYAKQYLGHKYVYGGDGSKGTFDCSGFTMYVYKHFGINLPHGATSQYNSGKGTKISKQSDLQIGDIVFLTEYSTGKGIGHCGIYIGNGNFIHASTTSYTVTISSLNTTYKGRFYAGLRLI